MTKPHTGELVFFWILFATVGLLTYGIMSPFLVPIFMAGVFVILFSPLNERMLRVHKGNRTFAALSTVLLVLCVILIPLIFFGILMFQEVLSIYGSLTQGNIGFSLFDDIITTIEKNIRHFVPAFEMNVNIYLYLEKVLGWAASHLDTFFSGILSFIFQIFLIIVAMFFMYRDGNKLREFAIKWSPLADSYDESIIAKIETAVSSVVKGALTIAIVQGLMVGIGFTIFGIPNPILWGVVATIAAIIPLVGTGLITIPAAGWLLITGNIAAGVGLFAWGIICVGLVDNVLQPYMINRGIHVHPFLILLSVFGGLAYFGPVGFLAGPIVLAFFFALLEIYPLIVRGAKLKDAPDASSN